MVALILLPERQGRKVYGIAIALDSVYPSGGFMEATTRRPKMHQSKLVLVLAFLITVSPVWAGGQCTGEITSAEVEQAEDARYAAQAANDFQALERLIGDDLVYIHSSGVMDDKQAFIESMRSGNVHYKSMRRIDAQVRTYGCIGILTGTIEIDLVLRGEDAFRRFRFTTVWVKRDGGPQFVSWQTTPAPNP
jgi:ketosteroid isomerase-like protein